jgi:hypothetical protein
MNPNYPWLWGTLVIILLLAILLIVNGNLSL